MQARTYQLLTTFHCSGFQPTFNVQFIPQTGFNIYPEMNICIGDFFLVKSLITQIKQKTIKRYPIMSEN